mgnify:CR=1 FL=1
MKRKLQLLTGIGCLCLCFLSCSQPPYKNPALSPEERANEVACQIEHIMTFEEIEKLRSCRIRPFEGGEENSAK